MKARLLCFSVLFLVLAAGSAFAQMGGGGMGPGGGNMGSPGMGGGTMGGRGSGMTGAGGMVQRMMGNTLSYGHQDVLNPIETPDEARAAVQAFINSSNSNLQISGLWEYGTIYKAELSDTKGAMAFDLIADKFTGAVMPEMGMSMMLNASYGKGLYKPHAFRKNLTLTPDQAIEYAQTFINNNGLGYTLEPPETYPGYYKFHTTHQGGPGMEIMVDGYNGEIWMNTYLGMPIKKY
jgi:hypothetical protein